MEEEIVKKKWKEMTFLQKAEYLWMYYKIWLVGAAAVIALIWLGIMMYKGAHTNVLLNVAVVGGDSQKAQELAEDFAGYCGVTDKDGVIRVKANVPDADGTTSQETVLTTLIGAEAVDVLICTGEVYEEYSSQEGFLSMEEILKDESPEAEERVLEHGIRLSKDSLTGCMNLVSYDDIYVAVPVTCQNPQKAREFVKYLLE